MKVVFKPMKKMIVRLSYNQTSTNRKVIFAIVVSYNNSARPKLNKGRLYRGYITFRPQANNSQSGQLHRSKGGPSEEVF